MTTALAAANFGAYALLTEPPRRTARCRRRPDRRWRGSRTQHRRPKSTCAANARLASATSSPTGNRRSARIASIACRRRPSRRPPPPVYRPPAAVARDRCVARPFTGRGMGSRCCGCGALHYPGASWRRAASVCRRSPRGRPDARRHVADVATLRAVAQGLIHQHQRQHRLADRGRADADAGSWRPVVTMSTTLPSTSTPATGRRRLEVGLNATETSTCCPVEMPPRMPPAWLDWNPAGVIASRCRLPVLRHAGEAVADLHALDRVDRHHRRGELAIELAVDRLAPARRHPSATTVTRAPTESPDLRSASM